MLDAPPRIFVLRMWTEPDGAAGRWRASLRDPRSGDRRYFDDPALLLAFLVTPAERGAASEGAPR